MCVRGVHAHVCNAHVCINVTGDDSIWKTWLQPLCASWQEDIDLSLCRNLKPVDSEGLNEGSFRYEESLQSVLMYYIRVWLPS